MTGGWWGCRPRVRAPCGSRSPRCRRLARPKVRLIRAENSHTAAGGTVFPLSYLRRIGAFCRKRSLRFHIDGSRIFNASVASGAGTGEYGKCCDSLMFCLSKGLGAPVGSVVAGPSDFIAEARGLSHKVGGGGRG